MRRLLLPVVGRSRWICSSASTSSTGFPTAAEDKRTKAFDESQRFYSDSSRSRGGGIINPLNPPSTSSGIIKPPSAGGRSVIKPNTAAETRTNGQPTKSDDEVPADAIPKFIRDKIRATGPVTVAEYMKIALTAPGAGYYTSRKSNLILGTEGDFITSPELGQMFGETIGVWVTSEVFNMGQGQLKPWQLVELGPGSGIMMDDVLRVLSQFKMINELTVNLVEVNEDMARRQAETLLGGPNKQTLCDDGSENWYQQGTSTHGVPIYWFKSIDLIPERFGVFLAHEFFDALPIHHFQRGPEGKWHEVCVDVDDETERFKFVLSARNTPSLHTFLPKAVREDQSIREYEVSPEGMVIADKIAKWIYQFGGCSLFVDYGHYGDKNESTLRGFHKHAVVDPLENAGSIDLTADVNFKSILDHVSKFLLTYGPVTQSQFLLNMGVDVRYEKLREKASSKQKEYLEKCYKILMGDKEMGERFKVMAMFPATVKPLMEARDGGVPAGFKTPQPLKTDTDTDSDGKK